MARISRTPILFALLLALGCQSKSPSQEGSKTALSKVEPAAKAPQKKEATATMTPPKQKAEGEPQAEIAPAKGADVSALPADVFMRFQEIKLAGEGCSSNYRFLLHDNGRFFMQQNSAKDDCSKRPAGSAFNKGFESKPMKELDAKALGAIRTALDRHGFAGLPTSISPPSKRFDGSMKIMEVRSGGKVKRVISVKSASKAIEAILEAIWAQVY